MNVPPSTSSKLRCRFFELDLAGEHIIPARAKKGRETRLVRDASTSHVGTAFENVRGSTYESTEMLVYPIV